MSDLVPFRITVCGLDELPGHRRSRVSHVLSILDPEWPAPDAFGRYRAHTRLELRFHDVIEPEPPEPHMVRLLPPERGHVDQILAFGRSLTDEGGAGHLLVHCHAGVSRSTASMALILAQARPDETAAKIFDTVLAIRPRAWPNLRILEFGDAMLGRQGELTRAVLEVYRRQAARYPEMVDAMAAGGRRREVAHLL